jgi:hypothetical protein
MSREMPTGLLERRLHSPATRGCPPDRYPGARTGEVRLGAAVSTVMRMRFRSDG